jgi:hypothetical protein
MEEQRATHGGLFKGRLRLSTLSENGLRKELELPKRTAYNLLNKELRRERGKGLGW